MSTMWSFHSILGLCSLLISMCLLNNPCSVSHAFSTPAASTPASATTISRQMAFLTAQNIPPSTRTTTTKTIKPLFMSSFSVDGSEYSSGDSDYDNDDDMMDSMNSYRQFRNADGGVVEDDVPTVELQPVPMSKNAGNRFVALYWDHELERLQNQDNPRDPWQLHYDRDELNEDHVMFCRKRNLYNETFNQNSMVDIMRSFPILSSDLQRIVGQCLIMETPDIKYVNELLQEEPILKSLTGNGATVEDVPLYRWRHIRDHTLRIDDGRFGYPCMIVGLDDDPEVVGNTRLETEKAVLEYLIRSKRVIMAGPLHLPTQLKDDPSSIPVGDLIMFNAKDRKDAIEFAENLPSSQQGLYKDLRVHFYNNLDITGKFVSTHPFRDEPGNQMKEAMEYWGYPVDDEQTKWLNW